MKALRISTSADTNRRRGSLVTFSATEDYRRFIKINGPYNYILTHYILAASLALKYRPKESIRETIDHRQSVDDNTSRYSRIQNCRPSVLPQPRDREPSTDEFRHRKRPPGNVRRNP